MIGDTLRRVREQKGLSLKDVEQGTSIRALYIESLEKGDYAALPGEVYAKGFLRNYAVFLGLDGDTCVRQYNDENHPDLAAAEETAAKDRPRRVDATHLVSGEDYRQRVNGDGSAKLILAALVTGVVLVGSWFAFFDTDDKKTPPVAVNNAQPAKQSKENAAAKAPAAHDSADKGAFTHSAAATSLREERTKPHQSADKEAVEVSASFTDRCWTKVVADGKTVYEGTADTGKTMSWQGKSNIVVTAGNAGAVEMSHNGKSLGKLGEAGQVVELTFTKDSVN